VNYEPDWDDDDETCFMAIGKCACGSEWFTYEVNGGIPVFTIDDMGMPIEANGHPRCVECGMDYPVVYEDPCSDEITIFFSDDIN